MQEEVSFEVKQYRAARGYMGMVIFIQSRPHLYEYFKNNPDWHAKATEYAIQVIAYKSESK
jgi:hypothetical protein